MAQKIALVTGSTSGIGLSTAKYFCEKGIKVLTNGLDKKIDFDHPNLLEFHSVNLGDNKERNEYINLITRKYKGVDILINNAGRFDFLSIEDTSLEILQSQIDINIKAPFALIQNFLPYMKQNKYGRIVNVSSQKGLKGDAFHSAYSTTKHALVGLTKAVAIEVALDGITCNAICPGWVATPHLMKDIQKMADQNKISVDEQIKMFLRERKSPNTILTKPEDIAATMYFMISDAASQMTGITLSHDSGNAAD